GDLVHFDLLADTAAALANDDALAEADAARADRDVDVLVEVLPRLAAGGPTQLAILDDADDHVLFLVQDNALADDVLEGEQLLGHARAQDDHVAKPLRVALVHLVLAVHEEAAHGHLEAVDLRIVLGGGDDPGVEHPLVAAHLVGENAHRHLADHGLDH